MAALEQPDNSNRREKEAPTEEALEVEEDIEVWKRVVSLTREALEMNASAAFENTHIQPPQPPNPRLYTGLANMAKISGNSMMNIDADQRSNHLLYGRCSSALCLPSHWD